MELKQRERDFLSAYLSNGGNATQAYLAIVPDAKNTTARIEGSRLKRKTAVSRALQEHNNSIAAKSEDIAVITKSGLLDHANWGLTAAREDRELGTLFKGIDTAAKLIGAYSQDEDDESKYAKFITKISVNQLTINQGVNTKEAKVVGHNTPTANSFNNTIDGEALEVADDPITHPDNASRSITDHAADKA